ncbi:MAG: hypothetical protein A4E69_00565 [Syntrophus sp. PtaB.Bin138]|jgi:hypothetical protein|nr:MAG: hypothetical protein A4E69_00565 [Syntrophus sp. PtaB.Bin138]
MTFGDSRVMKSMGKEFPETERFELFTGNKSINNIRLYQRPGAKRHREEDLLSEVRLSLWSAPAEWDALSHREGTE